MINEHLYRWRNRQLREHIAVIDGKLPPSIVLKNATYLNVYLKKWLKANIWIYDDRIVYVGDELPSQTSTDTEIVDCEGQYLVPGYIEPHAHPFQLYNPQTLSDYALKNGTTTIVNDNLMLLLFLEKSKALSLLDEFQHRPMSVFWWARFDSQSELRDDHEFLSNEDVLDWLNHAAVIQGGELTNWPTILKEDDLSLYWMQETKRLRKPVEGHFPGASEKTLTKMKLLGADGDHESINAEELFRRLKLGYYAAIRNSSIRPDLKEIIRGLKDYDINQWDYLLYTTDGSTPSFYEKGLIDQCIQIAIDEGVPIEEAYAMATINPAKYFYLDDRLGSIAPGRVAHINFLTAKDQPKPVSVMAKGQWIVKDRELLYDHEKIDWEKYGFTEMDLDWSIDEDDLYFSMPIGLEMTNPVILKPYPVKSESDLNVLSRNVSEAYCMLIDRNGKWSVSTFLKGFTKTLGGLVSSYSNTGDIILLGKSKKDMMLAFERMRELGGGIVLAHNGEIIFELPLPLQGMMTDIPMEQLIKKEKQLKTILSEHGYQYSDPVYTLLFLSSTHLPYIRITPVGIMDVLKKEILFPAVMR